MKNKVPSMGLEILLFIKESGLVDLLDDKQKKELEENIQFCKLKIK